MHENHFPLHRRHAGTALYLTFRIGQTAMKTSAALIELLRRSGRWAVDRPAPVRWSGFGPDTWQIRAPRRMPGAVGIPGHDTRGERPAVRAVSARRWVTPCGFATDTPCRDHNAGPCEGTEDLPVQPFVTERRGEVFAAALGEWSTGPFSVPPTVPGMGFPRQDAGPPARDAPPGSPGRCGSRSDRVRPDIP